MREPRDDDTIPYATSSGRESWFARRARGTGLRLIGIALMGAVAIFAENNNSGDFTFFYLAKYTFVGAVVAFAVDYVLSFFQ